METRGQYGHLVGRETTEHTLELTTDEKELILKLYDYGLKVLQEESDRDCLNAVVEDMEWEPDHATQQDNAARFDDYRAHAGGLQGLLGMSRSGSAVAWTHSAHPNTG